MGDEKQGLSPVSFMQQERADIPVSYSNLHTSRNSHLFKDAPKAVEMGGTVDLTCEGDGKDFRIY